MAWLIAPIAGRVSGARTPVVLTTKASGELCLPSQDDERATEWQAACPGRSVVILLHPAVVMRLPITLPRSARRNLREAVGYRLAVEAPTDPAALHFGIGAVRPRPDREEIVVEAILCARSLVANLEAAVEQAGASGCLVGFSDKGNPSPEVTFAVSHAVKRNMATTRLNRWLLTSACAIALSIGPALYASASWLVFRTEASIANKRSGQGEAIRLAEESARLGAVRYALAAARNSPELLHVLEDLAVHLPRQAWVSQLHFDRVRIKLAGFADDPTAIARSLEEANALAGVKLESVSRMDPGSGEPRSSQFVLHAMLNGEGAQ